MAGLAPMVTFGADGLALSPAEYAGRLARVAEASDFEADDYGSGGVVAAVEQAFAAALGKEAAIFLPTGTMANGLALQALSRGGRVLVQADSHVFNDTGDALARTFGVPTVPLAPGRRDFGLEEVAWWVERSVTGRVTCPVTAISIETPVRRHHQRMFDAGGLEAICAFAQAAGIKLHLDGARLFDLPFHTGRSVGALAAPFDTVFISLRKAFSAASGALLVGDSDLIGRLAAERRRRGGALPRAWPLIALVPSALAAYEADYAAAWSVARSFVDTVSTDGRIRAERLEAGTSIFRLRSENVDPLTFAARLEAHGVRLPSYDDALAGFPMRVNATLLRCSADDLASRFLSVA